MRILSISALVACVLLITLPVPSAQAQDHGDVIRFGQRDIGFSPRTIGLGGAAVGGIADWGATVANPAGLALARRSHVTGSLELGTTGSEPRTGEAATARATRFLPGHGAYVAALPVVRGAFVLGLGYHHTSSLDRRLFFEGAGDDARFAQFFESGWLSEVSAVGAIEVAPRIYLGASFNVPFGNWEFTELIGESRAIWRSFFVDSEMTGFNLRGGLLAEPVDGFRVGLSLESPTWLHTRETFGEHAPGVERSSYTVQLPWRVAAGAVYQFEGLLVSVDLEFADWAQARLRPTGRFAEENFDIARLLRETLDVRIGSEYDFGLGAVRAGYALSQDPLRAELEIDRARHTFASGFSFYLPRGMTLDLGVAYTEFQDQVSVPDHEMLVRETVGRFRAVAGLQVNL